MRNILLVTLVCLMSCNPDVRQPDPEPVIQDRCNLPCQCQHLYDNGTSLEWQECMGVGPR